MSDYRNPEQFQQSMFENVTAGGNITVENLTQIIKILQQPSQKTPKDSFPNLLRWISEKSIYLEKLHSVHGKEVLELIRKARNPHKESLDFTDFEVKVLDLVLNYCNFFRLGGMPRSLEFQQMKKADDYYSYLEKLVATNEKIRVGSVKLSSLVGDIKMSKLVEQLEKNGEF